MVDIKKLEEAFAKKKKDGKGNKQKGRPRERGIYYVDKDGNEVEPEDLEKGQKYYVKER
jgi:hypothetical protein